jgi:carboxylate-amine ligase
MQQELQQLEARLMICGLHIDVGAEDEDPSIEVMDQVTYFLPHLLAPSTKSPFWQGRDRAAGVPSELVRQPAAHWAARAVRELSRMAGLVEQLAASDIGADASRIWRDMRTVRRRRP